MYTYLSDFTFVAFFFTPRTTMHSFLANSERDPENNWVHSKLMIMPIAVAHFTT
jgi:hypothetical protein